MRWQTAHDVRGSLRGHLDEAAPLRLNGTALLPPGKDTPEKQLFESIADQFRFPHDGSLHEYSSRIRWSESSGSDGNRLRWA